MSKRVIKFGLSATEVNRAIREVEAYKAELIRKCELLRERIAERVAWSASRGFSVALSDDWIGESAPSSNVQVTVTHKGTTSIVFAEGSDAVFIEFGAGVSNNGEAGSSPHPKGGELGFVIGGYGKGKGKQTVWGFRGEDGELHFTRGTPAAMPMYHAVQDACAVALDLAREVFGP